MFPFATLFLGLSLALTGVPRAEALTRRGDYEASLVVLKNTKPTPANHAQYSYLMAVNAFALNRKALAEKWVNYLEEDFDPETPRRYRTLAALMRADLEHWKRNDLGDVSRDMRRAHDRLQLGRAGEPTQVIQDEIVRKLDRLIQQAEDKKKQQQQAANGKGEGDGKPDGKEDGKQAGDPNDPLKDSKIATNGGAGNVNNRKLKNLTRQWGQLPEKERAKALQDLTRDLPPKHREVIENYFRKMARDENAKK